MNSFIDLREEKIESRNDLLKYSFDLRNPNYENFRIVYMKENKSIGYETIVSRIPNILNRIRFNTKFPYLSNDELCEEISRRMYLLGANGYYIQRNSTNKNVKATHEDISIAKGIAKKVKGFRGYIIVANECYAWIGKKEIIDNIRIEYIPDVDTNNFIDRNPLMQKYINNRNDLARFIYDVKYASHYLSLILISNEYTIKSFQELPNSFINMSYRMIYEYIKTKCLECDACRAYITTTDKMVFDRAKELVHFGYLSDCIAYTITSDKAKIIEEADTEFINQNLFRDIEENKGMNKLKWLTESEDKNE